GIGSFFESQFFLGAPRFELGGHIIVEAKSSPHTSRHSIIDALMFQRITAPSAPRQPPDAPHRRSHRARHTADRSRLRQSSTAFPASKDGRDRSARSSISR